MMRCIDCLNSVVPITVWFCAKLRIKFLFFTLDAAVLRCCLFPVHFRRSATSIETHLRFRQRCLLRCVSSFTYGNIQRLEQLHLRSDEKFSEGSCSTPLPFRSKKHYSRSSTI